MDQPRGFRQANGQITESPDPHSRVVGGQSASSATIPSLPAGTIPESEFIAWLRRVHPDKAGYGGVASRFSAEEPALREEFKQFYTASPTSQAGNAAFSPADLGAMKSQYPAGGAHLQEMGGIDPMLLAQLTKLYSGK